MIITTCELLKMVSAMSSFNYKFFYEDKAQFCTIFDVKGDITLQLDNTSRQWGSI
jgi:hypothetical protein